MSGWSFYNEREAQGGKTTMTISTEVSKPAVYTFRARDYDVFAGLDVIGAA
jgi:hypothetical protein